MIRKKFNENWTVKAGNVSLMSALSGGGEEPERITLPHDAMIHEERTPDTGNGSQTGFYPGNVYTYVKQMEAPAEWEGKSVALEFEGVYMNARVYVNGDYAGGHPYGYTNFYVSLDDFLNYGSVNEIKVIANNQEETSRWYSGGGIYRNVNLIVGDQVRLKTDGLKVTTPDVEEDWATVAVKTELVNSGTQRRKVFLAVEILDTEGKTAAYDRIPVTSYAGTTTVSRQRMEVSSPALWDCDTPNLYTCRVTVCEGENILDEESAAFGIRRLSLSAQHGLRVNGREVKLRGTCIHHDNGIIGAATLERAEERRCEQLKAAGFNCIRSSHHPMSKAMLDACDRIGMYVMDELSDIWTRPKNSNDYSLYFPYMWEKDVERMVDKDFNHPCVIMYSMGNEIQEAGTAKGAEWNRKINNRLKELDGTRYTTNAINGMLAGVPHMAEILREVMEHNPLEQGVPKQEPLENGAPDREKQKPASGENQGGADALNGMMAMLSGPLADKMALSSILSEAMDEYASGMDITGYNYLTALHAAEKQRHPNRVVLGSETYPGDIVRLWDIVENNTNVIGDMTWTGYDYLGEAGCGIFYYDGTRNFTSHWPDRIAYIGDIDILGYRRPISYLREIVFGLRKDPYIAVLRMNRNGQKPSGTPWMWKDNIESWTWPGYEGQTASVDVYAKADEVELFLNGRSLGTKPIASSFAAVYDVPYEPGELKAVSRTQGIETGSFTLATADMEVSLCVTPDRTQLKADGADLSFITVSLTDASGRRNLHAQKEITVQIQGPAVIQGFGSADPQALNSYDDTTWPTYDGQVMAAVRAAQTPGEIKVTFSAPGCAPQTVLLTAH